MSMSLGELFRHYRERQGLSRGDVARQSDVTTPVISRLEEGENIGRADTVARVATVLGIPPNEVFQALLEGEAERIVKETELRLTRLDALKRPRETGRDKEVASVRRLSLAVAGG